MYLITTEDCPNCIKAKAAYPDAKILDINEAMSSPLYRNDFVVGLALADKNVSDIALPAGFTDNWEYIKNLKY